MRTSEERSDPLTASLKDVNFYRLLSLMICGQHIFRIVLRQVLMKVWILFVAATVVLQVSAP